MTSVSRVTCGNPYFGAAANAAFSNLALDASSDKVGFVFQAVSANAITNVLVRYGARTGTPPTYKIGLQGVSASTGAPDGTYKGGGSPASTTFTPPADATWDGTIRDLTLDNSYTPARGEKLALVVEYSSGTVDASNNSSFSYQDTASGAATATQALPYSLLNTGSWAKNNFSPLFGIKTASEVYGAIWSGSYTTAVTTIGHRSVCKFNRPGSTGTYQVLGFRAFGQIAAATGKAPIFGLWNAAGTALQSVTWDSDCLGGTGTDWGEYIFDETTLESLSFGTDYYIGFEVGDAATGNVFLHGFQTTSGNISFPGSTNFILSTWNGSAWTDDATVRPRLELIIADETISASGGLKFHPGMTGHMNG